MPPIRLVIIFVGVTLLGALVGIIVLASNQQPVPDERKIIAVSALTGLLGLLAPTRSSGP